METTLTLYALGAAAVAVAAEAQDSPRAVQGETSVAGRSRAHGAPVRAAGSVLRVRRGSAFSRSTTRRTKSPRGDAPASCGWPNCIGERFAATAALTGEVARRHLRPAVHRRLPRAVSVQPFRARASHGRRLPAGVGRRDADRSRRQPVLRPDRLVRRECVRLRLLQGMHRPRQPRACATSARCSAPTTRWWRTTSRACERSPGSTKCPSTCPAPKRSCRRCGSRATTPAARTSCASAAPTTAGGATCSRASATRSPAHETYTLKDMDERHAARAAHARATSPACWSIRCRRCIRTPARPAIRPWSTAAQRALRSRRLYAPGCSSCARCARERGIVLIFDEVFVGFRLAPGGAQEYFGVRADMVTYGKTLGGGLPVGVVCGRKNLMKRYPRRPPGGHLLRARHVQLASVRDGGDERVPAALETPEMQALYARLDARLERARAPSSTAAAAMPACRSRSPTCPSIWTVLLHPAQPLQLDVPVSTCAPRGWR